MCRFLLQRAHQKASDAMSCPSSSFSLFLCVRARCASTTRCTSCRDLFGIATLCCGSRLAMRRLGARCVGLATSIVMWQSSVRRGSCEGSSPETTRPNSRTPSGRSTSGFLIRVNWPPNVCRPWRQGSKGNGGLSTTATQTVRSPATALRTKCVTISSRRRRSFHEEGQQASVEIQATPRDFLPSPNRHGCHDLAQALEPC